MPQGRRKTPFSGKAKKEQLKAKKNLKGGATLQGGKKIFLTKSSDNDDSDDNRVLKINQQPSRSGNSKQRNASSNRYALQFHRETDAELRLQKEQAYHSIIPVSETESEIDAKDFYCEELDFPKRPPWNSDMTVEQLNAREQRYLTEYITNIEKLFNWKELGFFELNLETWRQLWRVLEMSDILLFIIDIRFAAAMFPPSLYDHVTKTLNKEMILVLNKIDLAPAPLVTAWLHYFQEKYPELKIIMFTSFPGYNLRNQGSTKNKGGLQTRRRRGKQRMAAEGAQKLYDTCKTIVGDQVDLSSWHQKILEEMHAEYDELEVVEEITAKPDTKSIEYEKFKDGVLTIGCVGQPNVGKSSLMNAIMGRKVVSVSKTPGHTKHFQTIFLTPNVRLCDCPGLVFPSKVPKNLQVLMGTFPIAQLRQPYSAVRYIAERLDLPHVLRLKHPEGDDTWSAMDICEAWAKQRGYLTAKAARPDTYRAANALLRMQLEGKICINLKPPGYNDKKDFWESHPMVETVVWIQAKDATEASAESVGDFSESSDDEEKKTVENSEDSSGDDGGESSDSEEVVVKAANPFSALAD